MRWRERHQGQNKKGHPEPVSVPAVSGMTTEDLWLSFRIKEEENRNKELEVQVMHLHIRALELEKAGTPVVSTPQFQCKLVGEAQEVCAILSTITRLRKLSVKVQGR